MFPWWRRTARSPAAELARAHWRHLSAPDPRALLEAARFSVVDTETTDLDPARAEILAIGTCRVERCAIDLGGLSEIPVRPSTPSGAVNVLVHGIGQGQQECGLPVDEALSLWLRAAMPGVLVGYHALFDATILARHARGVLGLKLPTDWLDLGLVLPMLFDAKPVGVRDLDHWLDRFGIRCRHRHGAGADALATAQLLLMALEKARSRGIDQVRGLRLLQHEMLSAIAGTSHGGTGA